MRYQRCHPIHSSYPLRDEQILTGRRVTIKYIGGEQPGRPSEDSWIEPPTRESRTSNKIEGRWNGYTFFELHSPVHGAKAASYYVGTRPVGEWARQEHTLPPHLRIPEDMRAEEAADLRHRRVHDPVGTGLTTERTARSSASTDGPMRVEERPPINSTASASTALLPGARAKTTGWIGKPPPPTPPMERWTGLPEGLRLALQALTDSERDWERPPGSEPIYWVQVGNRMFHRNDLMRQAIMMEQQPDAEVPQLQLTLVDGRTDNGTPCYIATAMPEGGSSGSGTISSTLPTATTDWSTPDSTRAQADGSLGSAASACQGLHRRGGGEQQPKAMASYPRPPPGLQQEATSAYGMLIEANQTPSLSGSAESPYVFDWPEDDRISWSRLREEGNTP